MDAVHLIDRNFSYEYGYRVDTTTGNSTIDSVDWVENQRRIKEAMGKITDLEQPREQVAIFDFDGEQERSLSRERVVDEMKRLTDQVQNTEVEAESLVEVMRPYHYERISSDSEVWISHS